MDSADLYEAKATGFLGVRDNSSIGSLVVRRWAECLPDNCDVLELACGGGYPITIELACTGLNIWAIDSSDTMLTAFAMRFPKIPTQCARVQDSDFFNRQFDAVVAVGLVFLLSEQVQADLINKVADTLNVGGRFLFTAPTEVGTWRDIGTGATCTSLGYDAYMNLLTHAGFVLVANHVDAGDNHYYDVQKTDVSK